MVITKNRNNFGKTILNKSTTTTPEFLAPRRDPRYERAIEKKKYLDSLLLHNSSEPNYNKKIPEGKPSVISTITPKKSKVDMVEKTNKNSLIRSKETNKHTKQKDVISRDRTDQNQAAIIPKIRLERISIDGKAASETNLASKQQKKKYDLVKYKARADTVQTKKKIKSEVVKDLFKVPEQAQETSKLRISPKRKQPPILYDGRINKKKKPETAPYKKTPYDDKKLAMSRIFNRKFDARLIGSTESKPKTKDHTSKNESQNRFDKNQTKKKGKDNLTIHATTATTSGRPKKFAKGLQKGTNDKHRNMNMKNNQPDIARKPNKRHTMLQTDTSDKQQIMKKDVETTAKIHKKKEFDLALFERMMQEYENDGTMIRETKSTKAGNAITSTTPAKNSKTKKKPYSIKTELKVQIPMNILDMETFKIEPIEIPSCYLQANSPCATTTEQFPPREDPGIHCCTINEDTSFTAEMSCNEDPYTGSNHFRNEEYHSDTIECSQMEPNLIANRMDLSNEQPGDLENATSENFEFSNDKPLQEASLSVHVTSSKLFDMGMNMKVHDPDEYEMCDPRLICKQEVQIAEEDSIDSSWSIFNEENSRTHSLVIDGEYDNLLGETESQTHFSDTFESVKFFQNDEHTSKSFSDTTLSIVRTAIKMEGEDFEDGDDFDDDEDYQEEDDDALNEMEFFDATRIDAGIVFKNEPNESEIPSILMISNASEEIIIESPECTSSVFDFTECMMSLLQSPEHAACVVESTEQANMVAVSFKHNAHVAESTNLTASITNPTDCLTSVNDCEAGINNSTREAVIRLRARHLPGDLLSSHNISIRPWLEERTIKLGINSKEMLHKNKLRYFFKCMGIACSYATNSERAFHQHLDDHENMKDHNNNWLDCPYCIIKCTKKKELVIHMQTEHAASAFQCPFCFYRSCAETNVITHENIYHNFLTSYHVLVCTPYTTDTDALLLDAEKLRNQNVPPIVCSGKSFPIYVLMYVFQQKILRKSCNFLFLYT